MGGPGTNGGGVWTGSTSSTGRSTGCTCTADANDCTDDVTGPCPGADESSCHTPAVTKPCTDTTGNPGFCDAAGVCTPCNECADASCTHRCVGQQCGVNGDCANGKCVDGFCCDTDCTGACNACSRVPGICQPLPVGMAGECPAGQLCGNTGTCKPTPLKALGELTNNCTACESGTCIAQICVSPNGQPCVEHLECASRLCDPMSHKCAACVVGTCPDMGTCLLNNTCQALPGQPATSSADCQLPGMTPDGLTCTLPVGQACTDHFECAYHDCEGAPNGVCAAPCMVDAECPMGMTCNTQGLCRLPPGTLCVTNEQCQGPVNVGTCSGFPRRCQ